MASQGGQHFCVNPAPRAATASRFDPMASWHPCIYQNRMLYNFVHRRSFIFRDANRIDICWSTKICGMSIFGMCPHNTQSMINWSRRLAFLHTSKIHTNTLSPLTIRSENQRRKWKPYRVQQGSPDFARDGPYLLLSLTLVLLLLTWPAVASSNRSLLSPLNRI